MNFISYHELRKISPERAREVVRKVFEKNERNVSKTARVLGISRATVRREVQGPFEYNSRRPKRSPRRAKLKRTITYVRREYEGKKKDGSALSE